MGMETQKYLHGYNKKEQDRLIHQAKFLEPYIYSGIDLEFTNQLLEVGCGVGAQTKILCRRFPDLKIDALDLSQAQLDIAKDYLKTELSSKQVRLFQQDAQKLKLKNKKYDAAFLCWFLEHVPSPAKVLQNVRKHLKADAKIYCTEVFNHTLFVSPYSPALMKYWFEFNDYQWTIKGHPFVGGQLGNLLKDAGFSDIQTEMREFHFDKRNAIQRASFIEYFYQIMLSAEHTLRSEKRVDAELMREMKKEVQALKKDPNAVFFYAFVRATAKA